MVIEQQKKKNIYKTNKTTYDLAKIKKKNTEIINKYKLIDLSD